MVFLNLDPQIISWNPQGPDISTPFCGWWLFTNPSEKYARQKWIISPRIRGEIKNL